MPSPIRGPYRVDFSKLGRTFPELSLEWDAARGGAELIARYRELDLTTEDFDGRRYVRLRQLRHLIDEGALGPDLRWTDTGPGSGALHGN